MFASKLDMYYLYLDVDSLWEYLQYGTTPM